MLQSEQLIVLAMVNGSGMEAADFVAITVDNAANGLANRIIYIRTPSFPTSFAAYSLGKFESKKEFAKMIPVQPNRCCLIVPGRPVDPGGLYLRNSLK